MSLKKSKGNMYPWVTHTHAHLGGECPHKCCYCYVDSPRFGRPEKYKGQIRLIDEEFKVDYGTGKVVFIENCNDMFAQDVPWEFILRIIDHCRKYPGSNYVFQTKNPERMVEYQNILPDRSLFGTTVETNRDIPGVSLAPRPMDRLLAMEKINVRKFITIEPIMDFDPDVLGEWIIKVRPEFVNIGADSKGHGIPEPKAWKIHELIQRFVAAGIEIREKHNLERLLK